MCQHGCQTYSAMPACVRKTLCSEVGGKEKEESKGQNERAVLGAPLRNHRANAVRTLLQGKCLVPHPCCFWMLCTEIREKISSVRRERIMRDKAFIFLSFSCEDFLPQTERGTVLVPA